MGTRYPLLIGRFLRVLLLVPILACGHVGMREPAWRASPEGFASVAALGLEGTTGGAGGRVVTVDDQQALERHAGAAQPLVIRIRGTVAIEPFGHEIRVASDKTLLGLGDDAELVHGGLRLDGVSNVIIRNLTIRDTYVEGDEAGKTQDHDAVQADGSHHLWIDHCHFTRMGDGLIDLRKGTDYVTVSWTILSDHTKAFGIGWTDRTDYHVTVHHVWFRDTHERNPALDNGIGHFYNNHLQRITGYGINVRKRGRAVVENSVVERVARPYYVLGDEAELAARGNLVFDAPSPGDEPRGEAFDPRDFYAYHLDEAHRVPDLLREFAGPQPGSGS